MQTKMSAYANATKENTKKYISSAVIQTITFLRLLVVDRGKGKSFQWLEAVIKSHMSDVS